MNNNPIGIFDSGIGGITIYKEIHSLMPKESIIYLADSKNSPYGIKSKEEIVALSFKNTRLLLDKGCKLIVVACNTASTNAVRELRDNFDIPFIRIQPAIKPAALQSKTKVVGILATESTLSSDLYYETSQKFAQGVQVIEQKGNGIVSLIESGKMYSFEMDQLLKDYIHPMLEKNIDNLVLGCTHYPLLRSEIEKVAGEKVNIIDSGEAIARQTMNILKIENLMTDNTYKSTQSFYINKNSNVFQQLLNRFNNNFIAEKINF